MKDTCDLEGSCYFNHNDDGYAEVGKKHNSNSWWCECPMEECWLRNNESNSSNDQDQHVIPSIVIYIEKHY